MHTEIFSFSETTNYRCVLVPGNGNSGETYAGQFTGDACVKKCTDMKKTLKNINGVVMNNRNCWCELGMTGINNNRNLKTCFLREKEKNGESNWYYSLYNRKISQNTVIRCIIADFVIMLHF